jgi:hypothetical protein
VCVCVCVTCGSGGPTPQKKKKNQILTMRTTFTVITLIVVPFLYFVPLTRT